MLCAEERWCATTTPLCSQSDDRGDYVKDGVENGESLFYNIGITIFRDVFDFIPDRFTFYPRFLIHIY